MLEQRANQEKQECGDQKKEEIEVELGSEGHSCLSPQRSTYCAQLEAHMHLRQEEFALGPLLATSSREALHIQMLSLYKLFYYKVEHIETRQKTITR
jgi:hypothetical protein